jgi:hypothetical protein
LLRDPNFCSLASLSALAGGGKSNSKAGAKALQAGDTWCFNWFSPKKSPGKPEPLLLCTRNRMR